LLGGARDGLGFQIGLQPFRAKLASDAAGLVAPEGSAGVYRMEQVDAEAACADPPSYFLPKK
jgi:hypothetical protein